MRPAPRPRPAPPAARLAALLALLLAACGAEPAPAYRHVVLISLDTTRADHLGCYGGSVPTPTIDGLAAGGLVCRAAYAPAPTTLASHTSMMTGLPPHRHGVPRNGFVVAGENVTLAELLRDAGFHTAGFLGSFALESRFRLDQGFEHWDEDFSIEVDGAVWDQNQRRAGEVTDAALRHVERVRDEEDRLFLFVHYFDAHSPYDPPALFAPRGPDGPLPGSTQEDLGQAVAAHHEALMGQAVSLQELFRSGLTPELLAADHGTPRGIDERLAAQYAGEVAYVDHELGRLLDGLEERGILQDALVVVTGDHGETFWEHADLWNHGLWVYDTTMRVPLVLRLPDGRGAGRTLEQPVSTIDLLPTLCDLLGLQAPAEVEGTSLVPALDAAAGAEAALVRGPVFLEATQPTHPAIEAGEWPNARKARAVVSWPWKYVLAPYNGVEQLFHLQDDPGEQEDLLRDPTPTAQVQRELLRELLLRWSAGARPREMRFDAGQSEEVLRRLREIGYLDDAPAEGR